MIALVVGEFVDGLLYGMAVFVVEDQELIDAIDSSSPEYEEGRYTIGPDEYELDSEEDDGIYPIDDIIENIKDNFGNHELLSILKAVDGDRYVAVAHWGE